MSLGQNYTFYSACRKTNLYLQLKVLLCDHIFRVVEKFPPFRLVLPVDWIFLLDNILLGYFIQVENH